MIVFEISVHSIKFVVPENIYTTPTEGMENSRGRGWWGLVLKSQTLKGKCEAKLEFPVGWTGLTENPFHEGGGGGGENGY